MEGDGCLCRRGSGFCCARIGSPDRRRWCSSSAFRRSKASSAAVLYNRGEPGAARTGDGKPTRGSRNQRLIVLGLIPYLTETPAVVICRAPDKDAASSRSAYLCLGVVMLG